MIVGIAKETAPGECRVAATPDTVRRIIALGYQVRVVHQAGHAAHFPDEKYIAAGAEIVQDGPDFWQNVDIVLAVNPPSISHVQQMKPHSLLISFIWPARNEELVARLAAQEVTTLALDCVPRISRAQKMDVLSSMANIAGYRAIVEATHAFGRFLMGQITAAGKIPPAKVLVIGAGVAGLSAIGAARGLGAIVRAFDTRPSVKDQVKSMGAEFLELDLAESGEGAGGYAKEMSEEFIRAEMQLFADQASEVDIIVTTALIPGKPAPKLITEKMVRSMRPGSVIVDLAAEQGGNCELTMPGQLIVKHGVTIIGFTDLPSRLPTQSSTLYAQNLTNLLTDLTPDKSGHFTLNLEDVIIRGALVTHAGKVTWPPPQEHAPAPAAAAASTPAVAAPQPKTSQRRAAVRQMWLAIGITLAMVLAIAIGLYAPADFVTRLTVFVLAIFVGWQLIWNVTPALHTPLMSVTNAISGIILIGALLQMASPWYAAGTLLAAVAVLISTINLAGGFLVTQRMLWMFRKQG